MLATLVACDFTIHHDSTVDPAELGPPFAVAENARDVSAGRVSNGFSWLDYTVDGYPEDEIQAVVDRVSHPEWSRVQKPGIGEWFGGNYDGDLRYNSMIAWTGPDEYVFYVSTTIHSSPRIVQPVSFHLVLLPPSEAVEFLNGLDGIQELVEITDITDDA